MFLMLPNGYIFREQYIQSFLNRLKYFVKLSARCTTTNLQTSPQTLKLEEPGHKQLVNVLFIIIVIIIIISSAALDGPWPSQANFARKDIYPGHPPANFYNPLFLLLPLPRQSSFILVRHVLFDLQDLYILSF